jgi:pseudouridine-5'-phosphate glycosidase
MIEGRIKVGLTKDEIKRLGKGKAPKVAVRDIPYAVAKKTDGGFTVSSAVRIASASGILVMATGGIGGVHRGAAETFDISADLWELSRTPIIVVCSGAKAVLDIPATMEWLETHGVPVYGYETDEMPAFYSRSLGIKVPVADGACDVAEIARVADSATGARTATIIAVPVPEDDEFQAAASFITKAIDEAVEKNIKGKDLTPKGTITDKFPRAADPRAECQANDDKDQTRPTRLNLPREDHATSSIAIILGVPIVPAEGPLRGRGCPPSSGPAAVRL